jgi:hypothetical protein
VVFGLFFGVVCAMLMIFVCFAVVFFICIVQ